MENIEQYNDYIKTLTDRELISARNGIDGQSYPERLEVIQKQISERGISQEALCGKHLDKYIEDKKVFSLVPVAGILILIACICFAFSYYKIPGFAYTSVVI